MYPQAAWDVLTDRAESPALRAEARQALLGWLERGGFAPSKADGSPVSLDDVRSVEIRPLSIGETETAPDPIEITVSSDDIDPDADLGVTLTLEEDTAGSSVCTFHPIGVQGHHGVAYIDIRIDGEYFASGHAVCDGHVYEHVRDLLATVRHLPESVARRMANRVAAAWYSATSL